MGPLLFLVVVLVLGTVWVLRRERESSDADLEVDIRSLLFGDENGGPGVAGIVDAGLHPDDPALSPEQEADATILTQLGPDALGDRRAEVRAIGQQLHDAGGVPLMRAALHHAEALSRRQSSVSILREVEVAWDGIGRWQG